MLFSRPKSLLVIDERKLTSERGGTGI
jgi:hypothetical protein